MNNLKIDRLFNQQSMERLESAHNELFDIKLHRGSIYKRRSLKMTYFFFQFLLLFENKITEFSYFKKKDFLSFI